MRITFAVIVILLLCSCATQKTNTELPSVSSASSEPLVESPSPLRVVKLYVDDVEILFDAPARMTEEGSAIVPVNELNKIGLSVQFDGENIAVSKGDDVPIAASSVIMIDSTAFIPLRFIVDNFYPSFEWVAEERAARFAIEQDVTSTHVTDETRNSKLPTLKSTNIEEQALEIVNLFYDYLEKASALVEGGTSGITALIERGSGLQDKLDENGMLGRLSAEPNYICESFEASGDNECIVKVSETRRFGGDGYNKYAHDFRIEINSPADYYIKDIGTVHLGFYSESENEDSHADENASDLKDKIIGKWVGEYTSTLVNTYAVIYEFFEDGRCTYSMELPDGWDVSHGNYSISGNTLTEIMSGPTLGSKVKTETPDVRVVDDLLYIFGDDRPPLRREGTETHSEATDVPTPEPAAEPTGIVGEWEMQEDGSNYRLSIGADGSYKSIMSPLPGHGSGGWRNYGAYVLVSDDTVEIELESGHKANKAFRLDGEMLYFGENVTPYYRYVEPVDPNVALDEKYKGTALSPSYGNNAFIPNGLFTDLRYYILDGDRQYALNPSYAKTRYDVAKDTLEQQGYKDTPLYDLALRRSLFGL